MSSTIGVNDVQNLILPSVQVDIIGSTTSVVNVVTSFAFDPTKYLYLNKLASNDISEPIVFQEDGLAIYPSKLTVEDSLVDHPSFEANVIASSLSGDGLVIGRNHDIILCPNNHLLFHDHLHVLKNESLTTKPFRVRNLLEADRIQTRPLIGNPGRFGPFVVDVLESDHVKMTTHDAIQQSSEVVDPQLNIGARIQLCESIVATNFINEMRRPIVQSRDGSYVCPWNNHVDMMDIAGNRGIRFHSQAPETYATPFLELEDRQGEQGETRIHSLRNNNLALYVENMCPLMVIGNSISMSGGTRMNGCVYLHSSGGGESETHIAFHYSQEEKYYWKFSNYYNHSWKESILNNSSSNLEQSQEAFLTYNDHLHFYSSPSYSTIKSTSELFEFGSLSFNSEGVQINNPLYANDKIVTQDPINRPLNLQEALYITKPTSGFSQISLSADSLDIRWGLTGLMHFNVPTSELVIPGISRMSHILPASSFASTSSISINEVQFIKTLDGSKEYKINVPSNATALSFVNDALSIHATSKIVQVQETIQTQGISSISGCAEQTSLCSFLEQSYPSVVVPSIQKALCVQNDLQVYSKCRVASKAGTEPISFVVPGSASTLSDVQQALLDGNYIQNPSAVDQIYESVASFGPSEVLLGSDSIPNYRVVIRGDLEVQGSKSTVNAVTLEIEDKDVELARLSVSHSQQSGAGIFMKPPTQENNPGREKSIRFQYDDNQNIQDSDTEGYWHLSHKLKVASNDQSSQIIVNDIRSHDGISPVLINGLPISTSSLSLKEIIHVMRYNLIDKQFCTWCLSHVGELTISNYDSIGEFLYYGEAKNIENCQFILHANQGNLQSEPTLSLITKIYDTSIIYSHVHLEMQTIQPNIYRYTLPLGTRLALPISTLFHLQLRYTNAQANGETIRLTHSFFVITNS